MMDYIDVYSNSWGPVDYGYVVEGPGFLLEKTLATGTAKVSIANSTSAFIL